MLQLLSRLQRVPFWAIMLCFVASHTTVAQYNSSGISGIISSKTARIPNAVLEINHPPFQVHTDSLGQYALPHLPAGRYSLIIYAEGYVTQIHEIELLESHLVLNFQLLPQQIELNAIKVVGSQFIAPPQETSLEAVQLVRAYFERQNTVNFAEALNKTPGINSIKTGVGIGKPVIRGMSFNRVMVNDRGIKQEGQQWGADHGLELDPFDVDEVTITKGPASLLYGPDGMGGIIQLEPSPKPINDTLIAEATSTYQTVNDLFGASLSVASKKGQWYFKGRYTHQRFGDYRVPANQFTYAGFVLPIYENRLTNTAGRENHFSIQSTFTTKKYETSLTISQFNQQAGLFVGAVGIPNSFNIRHFGTYRNIDLPNQNNKHLKIISNTLIRRNTTDYFEIDLGFQHNSRSENAPPHAHGYGPAITTNLALGLELSTLTGNLRYHKQHHATAKSIIGIQLQAMENHFDGFEFLVPAFQSFQSGAYYFYEQQLKDRHTLTAGVRVDGVLHRIQAHEQPIYRNRVFTGEFDQRNPDINREMGNISGGIGGKFKLSSFTVAKVNLGSSFRMPTPIELSMNGVHHGNFRHEIGNATLQPERGYQADLSIYFERSNWMFRASPFFGYFDQYIYLAPSARFSPLPGAGAFWEYKQHNAIFTGGEASTKVQILKGLFLTSSLEYVWNTNLSTGMPLPLTPPFSALFQVEYLKFFGISKATKISLYFDYRISTAQNRTDRNERNTPGFHVIDAGMQIAIAHYKIQFSAMNLSNASYFNHLSRYRLLNLVEPGRNVSIRVIAPIGF